MKKLVDLAGITGILKEIKGSKEKYILFNRYMEALVAFHRYYGGKKQGTYLGHVYGECGSIEKPGTAEHDRDKI